MRGRLIVAGLAALVAAGVVALPAEALSAAPSPIDHGAVTIGKTHTKIVTITVDAGQEFGFVLGAGASAPFVVDSGTCAKDGIPFRGPGTCKIKHTFAPTYLGPAGTPFDVYQCPLGSGTCTSVPVVVNATGKGFGKVTPTKINYGRVALFETKTKTVKFKVDAGYQLEFLAPLSPPWAVDTGTCFVGGVGIVGPATCEMTHSFTPTDPGDFGRHLAIHECPTGGPSNTCFNMSVPATGVGAARMKASPKSLNYGAVTVGTTKSKTVTVTIDTGYHFSEVIGATPPISMDYGTCIAGGVAFEGPGTCQITPSYAPTASGPLTKNLTVRECQNSGVSACNAVTIPAKGSAKP